MQTFFFVAAALFVCGLGNAREHKTQASKMPFAPGPVSANQCKKVCGKHACVKYIREKKSITITCKPHV